MSVQAPSCPYASCRERENHRHPALGDGVFGPSARTLEQVAAEGAGPGPSRITLFEDVPCRCPTCERTWRSVAFAPLKPGQSHHRRLCDACAEQVERARDGAVARPRRAWPTGFTAP